MKNNKLRAKIRKQFEEEGNTISDWAEKEGFNRIEVYAVLSGRIKGIRGRGHEIAVKLGLKPNPRDSLKREVINE